MEELLQKYVRENRERERERERVRERANQMN